MQRIVLKSKLHRVTVTEAELHYHGSITIDTDLMKAADLVPYERVQVVNINNGSRLETYVIEGEAGSGVICMNGPAARLVLAGDTVMVLSYMSIADDELSSYQPKTVFVNDKNNVTEVKNGTISIPQDTRR